VQTVRTWRWYSKLFLALAIAALMVLLICVPLSRVLVPALVGLWLTVAAMAGAGGTDADGPPSLGKFLILLGGLGVIFTVSWADGLLGYRFPWWRRFGREGISYAMVAAYVVMIVLVVRHNRRLRVQERDRLRLEMQGENVFEQIAAQVRNSQGTAP
jgi:hypothetical protein